MTTIYLFFCSRDDDWVKLNKFYFVRQSDNKKKIDTYSLLYQINKKLRSYQHQSWGVGAIYVTSQYKIALEVTSCDIATLYISVSFWLCKKKEKIRVYFLIMYMTDKNQFFDIMTTVIILKKLKFSHLTLLQHFETTKQIRYPLTSRQVRLTVPPALITNLCAM